MHKTLEIINGIIFAYEIISTLFFGYLTLYLTKKLIKNMLSSKDNSYSSGFFDNIYSLVSTRVEVFVFILTQMLKMMSVQALL